MDVPCSLLRCSLDRSQPNFHSFEGSDLVFSKVAFFVTTRILRAGSRGLHHFGRNASVAWMCRCSDSLMAGRLLAVAYRRVLPGNTIVGVVGILVITHPWITKRQFGRSISSGPLVLFGLLLPSVISCAVVNNRLICEERS